MNKNIWLKDKMLWKLSQMFFGIEIIYDCKPGRVDKRGTWSSQFEEDDIYTFRFGTELKEEKIYLAIRICFLIKCYYKLVN